MFSVLTQSNSVSTKNEEAVWLDLRVGKPASGSGINALHQGPTEHLHLTKYSIQDGLMLGRNGHAGLRVLTDFNLIAIPSKARHVLKIIE